MKKSELPDLGGSNFYNVYINTLDDVNLMDAFSEGKEWFLDYVKELPLEKLGFSYGENKWTVAEVLIHIIDTERIFQYRAFRFSRNDKVELPGFDQDEYISESNSLNRIKEDILEEYLAVRIATITLFKNLGNEQLSRVGIASGIPWSVAALGFAISGHQKHHENILMDKYA
ncbi:DinB family protein [Maribacter litopenaei]|uniref:DinB family protein n=1 Tax=Maribacter litopenaei TaxID=2976127 RepID=A0ABY5YC64_9FLAO|nr:DinB family protein [Maribacter litopenaei]UWX56304.1 DinB family protein [Maribacter litopenaei]